jgi:putative hydrolase of the HAD superfamily
MKTEAGAKTMIKNLIIDMGNVLIQFNPALFIDRQGIKDIEGHQALMRKVFHSVEWVQMDWGVLDESQCESLVLPRLPKHLHKAASQLIHNWSSPVVPIPGMADFLKRCKEAGFKLYLLSNASRRLHDYWQDIPGHEHFDGLVVSADVGLIKPQPEIFEHLLDSYQLKAAECLFIDDMPLNIAGAYQAGIPGFIFRDNLEELEALVFGKQ